MKKRNLLMMAGTFVFLASACTSLQSPQGTLGNMESAHSDAAPGSSASPYVEAFIEFTGPQAKWAGPATFTMHVAARDSGMAKITVAPELFVGLGAGPDLGPAPSMKPARGPASLGMPSDIARDELAHLATSIQGGDPAFSGCTQPMRVRLIRMDGAVTEKQACRAQTGWPRVAADAVSSFITAALYGVVQVR